MLGLTLIAVGALVAFVLELHSAAFELDAETALYYTADGTDEIRIQRKPRP